MESTALRCGDSRVSRRKRHFPHQIMLTPEQNTRLSQVAEMRGESRSVVLRDALRRYFEVEGRDVQ